MSKCDRFERGQYLSYQVDESLWRDFGRVDEAED